MARPALLLALFLPWASVAFAQGRYVPPAPAPPPGRVLIVDRTGRVVAALPAPAGSGTTYQYLGRLTDGQRARPRFDGDYREWRYRRHHRRHHHRRGH